MDVEADSDRKFVGRLTQIDEGIGECAEISAAEAWPSSDPRIVPIRDFILAKTGEGSIGAR